MRLFVQSVVSLAACAGSAGEKPVGDDTAAPECADAELGTWYTDGDGDGFGDPEAPVEACTQPAGTVDDATD